MCVCLLPNLCLCVVIIDTVHVSGSSTPVQTHHMQSENITEKKKRAEMSAVTLNRLKNWVLYSIYTR